MSHLSYMEKLLNGVEVEWKALEGVAFFANGKGHEKVITENGNYIVVNSKFISTDGKVAKYSDEQLCPLSVDDILIVMSDLPNGKALAKTFIVDENNKYTLNQRIGAISVKNKKSLLPKFLNYFLNRTPYLTKYDNGVDQTNLKKGQILDVKVPTPCPENPKKSLEIQAEIVRILDAFTAMTTELTTELNLRKKQYNHYRDQLLKFEDGEVEWKTLGELTSLITKGTTPKKYTDKGIAFIKTEAFDGAYINVNKLSFIDEETHGKELKRSILNKDDILITIAGATIGKCAIVPEEVLPANTNQALAIIRLHDYVNLNYVFHLIKSNYLKKYIEQNIKGSAQPNLNLQQLNNFHIPFPSSEEQARIVAILDKFDALTNSITEGLPREIELRQKQYEYYRDLLLSFPKPGSEVAA